MKYIKVKKAASYKGFNVFISTKDDVHYNVSMDGPINVSDAPMDLLIDMVNVSKGEYFGKIRIDDPELKILD